MTSRKDIHGYNVYMNRYVIRMLGVSLWWSLYICYAGKISGTGILHSVNVMLEATSTCPQLVTSV